MNLNAAITKILKKEMVDLVGFADLAAYEGELTRFGGKIVEGYRYGISIGIAMPRSIVDHLNRRFDPNVACEYKTHAYGVLNDRLDLCASKIASFLQQRGHRSLPLSVAERTDKDQALPTVSHKMVAHVAGLGWIGKNCLLITPQHGPRVRWVTVLTQAPLKAVDNPGEQRCGDCTNCVVICPAQAIKGRNYVDGEGREARFDFKKCQDYFAKLKAKFPWDVCGMCLYACPQGKGK